MTSLRLFLILLPLMGMPVSGLVVSAGTLQAQQPADSTVKPSQQAAGGSSKEPIVVPPASPRALRYYREGMTLWGIATLLSLAVPAVILLTGFSATLRNIAQRIGGRWSLGTAAQRRRGATIDLAAVVFVAIFFAVVYAAEFPLAFYAGFVYQHAYDLSNQTFLQWLRDSLLTFGLETAFFAVVIPVGFFLLRALRRWWIAASSGAVVTLTVLWIVQPIWIAPLFDEYGRMENAALEEKILDIAERAGIRGSRVYEVKKSADTKRVNASVNGFLGTKRIVLWDTMINRLNQGQILFVMGHEMGHYVLGHAWKGLLLTSVGLVTAFYLMYLLLPKIVVRFTSRFQFESLGDVASLPLFVLTLAVLSLVAMPLGNAISRHWEHEADRFGLEITRRNRAAATTFLELQRHNLSNPRPGPIYMLWRGSHPSLADRVDFANTYRPWEHGEALEYGDRFGLDEQ